MKHEVYWCPTSTLQPSLQESSHDQKRHRLHLCPQAGHWVALGSWESKTLCFPRVSPVLWLLNFEASCPFPPTATFEMGMITTYSPLRVHLCQWAHACHRDKCIRHLRFSVKENTPSSDTGFLHFLFFLKQQEWQLTGEVYLGQAEGLFS